MIIYCYLLARTSEEQDVHENTEQEVVGSIRMEGGINASQVEYFHQHAAHADVTVVQMVSGYTVDVAMSARAFGQAWAQALGTSWIYEN